MSMGKGRKLVALLAVVAILAMALAGCAKTDGTTDDGAVKEVKVVIGVGAPLSDGAVALGKGMVRGTALAIDQANKSQEIKDLGITLSYIEGDDKGDPTTGGNVATQFVSNQNLVGVMGHLNSGVTRPAVKIYGAANIVQVSPANTAVDLTQMGMANYFRVCAIDSVQGPYAAKYAYEKAGKKAAFVVDDSTVYGVGLADEWAKQFEASGGKVVGRQKTGDKDTDFKALVSRIKAANPDLVYYGGIYKPKGQDFMAAYNVMFPGEVPAAYDAYSYDAANVIIKAIIAVANDLGADKVTTTEGKKAIIAAVGKTDFEGVTGQVKFDAKGDTLNQTITVYVVKEGKWIPAPL